MIHLINICIIATCILIQGFFSGSEMVLLSSNKLKLRRKAAKGSKSAKLILKMIQNSRWYLATTSTGTNMFVIISSVVAAVWFEHFFHEYGEIMTILIISPILLMFGEIIPRTVFQQRATELALQIAYPLLWASRIISPITAFVFFISKFFYGQVGKEAFKHHFVTREELELVLNIPAEASDVKRTEKKLIRRVFRLAKSKVTDMMVPLIQVVAIPHTATVREAIKYASQTGYSRIPVYKDRIDNLFGIVNAFDLIDVPDPKTSIFKFIRKVPFVPELKRADELLLSLQKKRATLAIVLDEYGGAVGIVTIEDILEEVVGEIGDEYDKDVRRILQVGPNQYLVNARIDIEIFNELLGINIPKEDYETLAGFLLKRMGKIPKKGEQLKYKDFVFEVHQVSSRAVHWIRVNLPDSPPQHALPFK